jgi:hypothetical protein
VDQSVRARHAHYLVIAQASAIKKVCAAVTSMREGNVHFESA